MKSLCKIAYQFPASILRLLVGSLLFNSYFHFVTVLVILMSFSNVFAVDYSNSFTVRPQLERKTLSLGISPSDKLVASGENGQNGRPESVSFLPNIGMSLGVGVSYKALSLTFSRDDSSNKDQVEANGLTSGDNYGISFEYSRLYLTVFHQNLKGFYVKDLNSDHESEKYPEVQLRSTGITVINIVNPVLFSLSSILDQSKRQTESGGSILMSFSVSSNLLSHNDDRILPVEVRQSYGDSSDITGIKLDEVNATAGYGYLLTKSNFYGSFALGIGPSMQVLRIESGGQNAQTSTGFSAAQLVVFGLGFNGPELFLGVNFVSESVTSENDDIGVEFKREKVQSFVGWRF